MTLAYAGLFLLVRLAVKFKVLALDDAALGVAYVSPNCCVFMRSQGSWLCR